MCEMTPFSGHVSGHNLDKISASAIADELVDLTTALSNLAYDLGSDPATVRKHMSSLQAIDLITQVHLALADMLRSNEPIGERLNQIPVEALGRRLRAKISNNVRGGASIGIPASGKDVIPMKSEVVDCGPGTDRLGKRQGRTR